MFLKEDFDNSENMCFTIKLQIPGNPLQRSCSRPCKSMALNKYCNNIKCKYAHTKEELYPYICKRNGKCIVSHCWFYHPKQESKNNYINRNFSKKDLLYYSMLPGDVKKTTIIYKRKNNKKDKKTDLFRKKYVTNKNIFNIDKIIKYILTRKKYSIELFF